MSAAITTHPDLCSIHDTTWESKDHHDISLFLTTHISSIPNPCSYHNTPRPVSDSVEQAREAKHHCWHSSLPQYPRFICYLIWLFPSLGRPLSMPPFWHFLCPKVCLKSQVPFWGLWRTPVLQFFMSHHRNNSTGKVVDKWFIRIESLWGLHVGRWGAAAPRTYWLQLYSQRKSIEREKMFFVFLE